mgnify:CR=1 FL=1
MSRWIYKLLDGVFILDALIKGLIIFVIGSACLAIFLIVNFLLLNSLLAL